MRTLLITAILLAGGCNADSFLSGQWTTIEPRQDLGSDVKLHLELNLGHFGSDVVGVIRYVTTEEFQFTSLGCEPNNTLPACPCSRISGTYKSTRETFFVRLIDCAGLERDLILHDGGAGLEGSLEDANGKTHDLEFEQTKTERQLTTSDKACDDCPSDDS
jgi:hypothetical protein